MNSFIRFLLSLFFCVFMISVTGCASIVSGSGPQAIPVTSVPLEAKLELTDLLTGNVVVSSKTPNTISLNRSAGYFKKQTYKLKLEKEGYIPDERVISPNVTPWYILGNIVFGGLIGWLIVDPATGAMYKYPQETISVKLYPDTPEGHMEMKKDMERKEKEELERRTSNR